MSGYALVVEDGTALARRVRRGEISAPDDDVLAQRYELLDGRLSQAGFDWYEVSNWSVPAASVGTTSATGMAANGGAPGRGARLRLLDAVVECQASQRLCASTGGWTLPVADFEELDPDAHHTEEVMLRLRLRGGLAVDGLTVKSVFAPNPWWPTGWWYIMAIGWC